MVKNRYITNFTRTIRILSVIQNLSCQLDEIHESEFKGWQKKYISVILNKGKFHTLRKRHGYSYEG